MQDMKFAAEPALDALRRGLRPVRRRVRRRREAGDGGRVGRGARDPADGHRRVHGGGVHAPH